MQNKNWASTKSTKTNKNTTKNNTPKKPTKIMCCNFNDVAFFYGLFMLLCQKSPKKLQLRILTNHISILYRKQKLLENSRISYFKKSVAHCNI